MRKMKIKRLQLKLLCFCRGNFKKDFENVRNLVEEQKIDDPDQFEDVNHTSRKKSKMFSFTMNIDMRTKCRYSSGKSLKYRK